jgi:hypothetical protein
VVERVDLGLVVLCGEDDLDRPVAWAHVSELGDPVPFLLGRELLLTAGVHFPDDVDRYVAGLVDKGVSALGFGVTPYYDEVPAELVERCRERGLPLLAVPPRTPFLAISQAVGAELAEAQNAELRLLADSQRALTRAAVRPRPIEGTLRALVAALDCWAVLLDADGEVLVPAGRVPRLNGGLRELAARVGAGSGPRSASTEVGEDHVVLNPVEQMAARPAVLAVGRARPFTVADRAVVAVELALLGLLRRDVDTSRGHSARLAARLLLTEDRLAVGASLALLLDNRIDRLYRVVVGHDVRRGRVGEHEYEQLVQTLSSPLVDIADGGFRAVVTEGATPTDAVLDLLHRQGWLVGVSASATATELPQAEREAAALLRRALADGRSVRAGDEQDSVTGLVDPAQAQRFAVRLLAPLAAHRTPSPSQLVETARAWLAQHGNWDRTAAALGVHRNSVRHRMGHVERVLGIDLSQAQQRTDLWCAINWLPAEWPDNGAG